jgi:hypothetical protein
VARACGRAWRSGRDSRARDAKCVRTGPGSIAHAELVGIIGEAIGEDVGWQDQPPETAREQLIAAWGNAAFVGAHLGRSRP